MTSKSLSIVIPLYDDAASLRPLCERLITYLRAQGISFEIILVDDGSLDATAAVLDEVTRGYPELIALSMEANAGQSRAAVAGLSLAQGDVVMTMDSDLETGLEVVPRMMAALRGEVELVCARRVGREIPRYRRLGSAFANAVARMVFGVRIHDFGCGTNAGTRALLDRWLARPHGIHVVKLALLRLARVTDEVEVDLRTVPAAHQLPPEASPERSRYRPWRLLSLIGALLWFRVRPGWAPRAVTARPRASAALPPAEGDERPRSPREPS